MTGNVVKRVGRHFLTHTKEEFLDIGYTEEEYAEAERQIPHQ